MQRSIIADCVCSVCPAVPPRGQWDPHVSLWGGNRVGVRVCSAPAIHEHQVGKECARLLHPPIIGSGTIWNSKAVHIFCQYLKWIVIIEKKSVQILLTLVFTRLIRGHVYSVCCGLTPNPSVHSWFYWRMHGGNCLFWALRSGPFLWIPPLFSPFPVCGLWLSSQLLLSFPACWHLRPFTVERTEQRKHGGSADEQDHDWDPSAPRGGHQVQTNASWRNRVRLFEMHRDVQSRFVLGRKLLCVWGNRRRNVERKCLIFC